MEPLDGNSIGSLLIDVFGTDMTTATSVCGTCNARRPVAELRVYGPAPGTVVRCPSCDAILMVFARVHDVICVDLMGLAEMSEDWPASSS